MAKRHLNIEEVNNLIKDYSDKIPIKVISKKYQIKQRTIYYYLERNDIKCHCLNKLKKVNNRYFDNLDNPNKAYILGFLYADGCIIDKKRGQKQIVINLHEKDVDILYKFKEELNFEGNLHFYKGDKIKTSKNYTIKRGNLYRLTISSNCLCNSLIKLGCMPRKSLTCKFPDSGQIPENLMSHFIRGLFDGDGYISKVNKDKFNPQFTFGILGTLDMCQGIRKYLSNKLSLNPDKKLKIGDNVFAICYANNKDLKKIFNYIYNNDSTLFLKRKFEIFKDIFNYKYKN